jgi:hypothetical protein
VSELRILGTDRLAAVTDPPENGQLPLVQLRPTLHVTTSSHNGTERNRVFMIFRRHAVLNATPSKPSHLSRHWGAPR